MALVDIVRNVGVKTASKVFDSMKISVTIRAWIGEDGKGGESYADPVAARCIVDLTSKVIQGAGQMITTMAKLTFLDPIADTTPSAGQVRMNPIDPRDIITLPDGRTAPIVQNGGPDDAGTNQPFLQEVVLGTVVRGQ